MESPKQCRGVRGATVVPANTAADIVSTCAELFIAMTEANAIAPRDIAAIVFTASPDLGAAFPAEAAEIAGFEDVPRICAQEIDVPGGLARCLRILVLWNTVSGAEQVTHVYLNGAEALTAAPTILNSIERHFPGS